MKSTARVATLIFLVFMLVLSAGCNVARRPEAGPGAKPAIPDTINQGENKEPELSVFIAETGEKKSMPFEEYIAGVVAAEMEPDWSVETLGAQAILARTFTLQKIAQDGGVPSRGTHASTDIEEFQAYDASRITKNVKEAVKATRGLVLAYNGKFIRAWFHAYSGGKTATAEEGLAFTKEKTPYVKVTDDPGKSIAPPEDKNWTVTLSVDEIRQKLKEQVGQDVGKFTSIEVAEKGPSGRATKLKIGDKVISAPAFRLSLDTTKVKSTWFTDISVSGNKVVLKGTGYGHGVGMSQWGAKALAQQGKKSEEIAKYFFTGVETFKMWN